MFVLQLNPMTSNAENVVPICRAETEQQLLDLLEREAVEPYITDDRWHKVFRKDGPLEWYNPPGPDGTAWIGVPAIIDAGTEDDWAQNGRRLYQRNVIEGVIDVICL